MGDPRQPVHQRGARQRSARADGDGQGRRRGGDRHVRAPVPRRPDGLAPRPGARLRRDVDLHPPDLGVQRGLRPREAGRPDLGIDRRAEARRPRPRLQEQGLRDPGPGGQGAHLRRRPRHGARQGHGPRSSSSCRPTAGSSCSTRTAPSSSRCRASQSGKRRDRRRRRAVLAHDRGHGRAPEGRRAHLRRAGRPALRGGRVHPHAADPLGDVRAALEPRLGDRRHLRRFAAARRDVLGPGPGSPDGARQLRRGRDRARAPPRARARGEAHPGPARALPLAGRHRRDHRRRQRHGRHQAGAHQGRDDPVRGSRRVHDAGPRRRRSRRWRRC